MANVPATRSSNPWASALRGVVGEFTAPQVMSDAAFSRMAQEFGGLTARNAPPLPRLTFNGAEVSWQHPDDDAPVKVIVPNGIPLVIVRAAGRNIRHYYDTPFNPNVETSPACFSMDGVTPSGGERPQSGPCATCPFAAFGSAKGPNGLPGKGQACRAYRTLVVYLITEVGEIPSGLAYVNVPPTGLKPLQVMVSTMMKGYGLSAWEYATQIHMDTQSKQLIFNALGPLSQDWKDAIEAMREDPDVLTTVGEGAPVAGTSVVGATPVVLPPPPPPPVTPVPTEPPTPPPAPALPTVTRKPRAVRTAPAQEAPEAPVMTSAMPPNLADVLARARAAVGAR